LVASVPLCGTGIGDSSATNGALKRAATSATANQVQRLPGSVDLNRPLQATAKQVQRLPGSVDLNRPLQVQRQTDGNGCPVRWT